MEAAQILQPILAQATTGLVDREALAELVLLGAVAGEHLLVIGPPGTAKSEAVRRVVRGLGGRLFEYLLGRFTEPNEIFGPVDLRRLREGVVAIETAHMLPEADVAFLDEVFLGSTAILNTLLAILNERRFRRGHTDLRCPLRTCVGASNALPEDPSLAAFADRFLLRCFVSRTMDPMLEDLLEAGWGVSKKETEEAAGDQGLEAVAALSAQLSEVELGGIRQPLSAMFRKLRGAGIVLSDRRMVRSQRLIAAAALLDGRTVADGRDLWPIYYVLPTEENQTGAREILGASLKDSRNRALSAAALEASSGPKARADRLLAQAQELFSQPESPERALKLEGLARELDAGFAAPLPPDLGALRTRLQSVLVI